MFVAISFEKYIYITQHQWSIKTGHCASHTSGNKMTLQSFYIGKAYVINIVPFYFSVRMFICIQLVIMSALVASFRRQWTSMILLSWGSRDCSMPNLFTIFECNMEEAKPYIFITTNSSFFFIRYVGINITNNTNERGGGQHLSSVLVLYLVLRYFMHSFIPFIPLEITTL